MYRLPKKVKAYFSLWGEVQGSRLIISGSDLQIEAYGFEYPAWAVEGLGSGIAAHVDSRGTLWVTHTIIATPGWRMLYKDIDKRELADHWIPVEGI